MKAWIVGFREMVSVLVALMLAIAVVVGAFLETPWSNLTVMACFATVLLGRRSVLDSLGKVATSMIRKKAE